ncbi:hypothetical protein KP509_06G084700 [Ceratopteris richardii]|uniref:RRM domain-containing protein n=1 Tax=Ceratopteris richardii TaxID=49495 RepID=A0A8T2UMI9_CERRI|nr:hypothetical protein KP509_06G084700 [Ceratopteris richardii]
MGEQQKSAGTSGPASGGAAAQPGSAIGPTPPTGAHHFRDTTYTKVFVGGLAWETQRDTMRRHFEQYGEIVEAVVIMDKNTGRSKGYGFVTFRDTEGARKACLDANPVIDGRRANCNLASQGAASRSRPTTPLRGNRMMGGMSPYSPGGHNRGGIKGFMASPTYPHQHFYPNYHIYGFPPYSQDYGYPQGMFNPYGVPQYPAAQLYGSPMPASAFYNPYGTMQYMQPLHGGASGGIMAGSCGPATYSLSPGGTSPKNNSSGNGNGSHNNNTYHGGTVGNGPPLRGVMHYGGIPNSGMMAGSSTPLFAAAPPSTIPPQLSVPSVAGEQPSA